MTETITLRLATLDDADILLDWRNDPETRRSSHDTAKVLRSDHFSWLSMTIDDPCRRLYVAEEYGEPVGTVRADFAGEACELSWTVASGARGRGVGKRMVAVLAGQLSVPVPKDHRVVFGTVLTSA